MFGISWRIRKEPGRTVAFILPARDQLSLLTHDIGE